MLLQSFLHLLILRFCCYQCYLELISRIIVQARQTESFIVHFNQRRRKSDCFSSCSKLVLLILQSLHALRFRLIKYGARESSLDVKKSSKSDIKHDSDIKDDIKDDSDIQHDIKHASAAAESTSFIESVVPLLQPADSST